jgi:ligand-binding sensor domain-containing protein
VSLYDGSTFTTFDAANSPLRGWVYDMAVDRKGRMWLATDEGPLRYDEESFQSLADEDGLEGKITRSVHVDSAGQVWLGSMGFGISRYDGEGYTPYTKADGLSDGNITSILEDRDGQMWFGTVGSGLMRYDGGRVRHFTQLRDGARLEYVRGMVAGAGQPLLVRGLFDLRYTLARFDGRAFGVIDTSEWVSHVVPDRDGGLWLALGKEGLGHDAGDGVRRVEVEALRGVRVDDLLLDHEGRLWVGGTRKDGGGFLGRMDGHTWTILRDPELLQKEVAHLFEDRDGRVWCVTGAGIVICQADSLTSFSAWTAEEPPSVIFQDTGGDIVVRHLSGCPPLGRDIMEARRAGEGHERRLDRRHRPGQRRSHAVHPLRWRCTRLRRPGDADPDTP